MERTETKPLASRLLAAALAVGVAIMCAFSLTACGQSDEDQAKKAVSSTLDVLKNFDYDQIKALLAENDVDIKDAMGGVDEETVKNLMNAWLDGFDYKITDVKVADGKTATVSLDVKCKKLMVAMESAQNKVYDEMLSGSGLQLNDGESYSDYSVRVSAYVLDKVQDELKNAETSDIDTSLTLTKTDKGWEIDDVSSTSIWMDMLGTADTSYAKQYGSTSGK